MILLKKCVFCHWRKSFATMLEIVQVDGVWILGWWKASGLGLLRLIVQVVQIDGIGIDHLRRGGLGLLHGRRQQQRCPTSAGKRLCRWRGRQ